MRRGTTPTLRLALNGIYASDLADVIVTFKQGRKILNVVPSVEGDVLVVSLTQEESLYFDADKDVSIQMKSMLLNGKVVASDIKHIDVKEILNEEVMG